MEPNAIRGRNIVIGVICILLGMSILSIAVYVLSIGTGKIVTQGIRFFLTCLLCIFIYKGYGWAKWITVVLMGIASLTSLLGAIAIITNPLLGIVSFVYFVSYASAVILLLVPKSVRDFLEYQKFYNS